VRAVDASASNCTRAVRSHRRESAPQVHTLHQILTVRAAIRFDRAARRRRHADRHTRRAARDLQWCSRSGGLADPRLPFRSVSRTLQANGLTRTHRRSVASYWLFGLLREASRPAEFSGGRSSASIARPRAAAKIWRSTTCVH